MKSIEYVNPVRWMRGSLSGHQQLTYAGKRAYDIAQGDSVPADEYSPRIVAKVIHAPYSTRKRYFQIRTRTTVNMSERMRFTLATMGGAGALFAALLRNKNLVIYALCVTACPKDMELRAFIMPILIHGLRNKVARIGISDGVYIINPWISSEEPNVVIPNAILDKFASELGVPVP